MATERELAARRAGETEQATYVSTVAHELRTPLTGLSGYLDLILDGQVDDEAVIREFLERGRAIVGSMANLIGDLLELARIESGSLVLETEPFSVAEALHTVEAALMPVALDRGLPLVTTPPPRMATAVADRRRVEQIITNLASNALKFGAEGVEVELAGWFDGPVAIVVARRFFLSACPRFRLGSRLRSWPLLARQRPACGMTSAPKTPHSPGLYPVTRSRPYPPFAGRI